MTTTNKRKHPGWHKYTEKEDIVILEERYKYEKRGDVNVRIRRRLKKELKVELTDGQIRNRYQNHLKGSRLEYKVKTRMLNYDEDTQEEEERKDKKMENFEIKTLRFKVAQLQEEIKSCHQHIHNQDVTIQILANKF